MEDPLVDNASYLAANPRCPLCGRDGRILPGKRKLYGTQVCFLCFHGFANRRQAAVLLDCFCLFIVTLVFALVAVILHRIPTIRLNLMTLYLFVLCPAGFIFSLRDGLLGGKSPGKALCGVEVRSASDYQPIGFAQSLKRNIVLLLPFVVFVVLIQMSNGKRTGDGWADTRVIWSKYADNPVFTGRPAKDNGADEFDEGDGRQTYVESDNPFHPPQA